MRHLLWPSKLVNKDGPSVLAQTATKIYISGIDLITFENTYVFDSMCKVWRNIGHTMQSCSNVLSLVYTPVADCRSARRQSPTIARVFILQLATVASACGRLSSAVADSWTVVTFNSVASSRWYFPSNQWTATAFNKVTTHADLKEHLLLNI